jgi:hypothetical protein
VLHTYNIRSGSNFHKGNKICMALNGYLYAVLLND